MFKKKHHISDLKPGYLLDGEVMVSQIKNEIRKIDINSLKILNSHSLTGNDTYGFYKYSEGHIGIGDELVIFFDPSLELIEELEVEPCEGLLGSESLISMVDYSTSTFLGRYGLFDLELRKNIWITDWTSALVSLDGRCFFAIEYNQIVRLDCLNGSTIWKYAIQANPEHKSPQLKFVTRGLAIFGLEDFDKLIALDLETGALKWERTTLPSYYQLDSKRNKLHVITAAYKCIDPDTSSELDSFEDRVYFDEVGIFSQRGNYAIVDDHIITTDYQKGVIGAFNTKTHRFDWVHREEGVSFPAANPVRYHEPYLFVHDNKGTLHVFERE